VRRIRKAAAAASAVLAVVALGACSSSSKSGSTGSSSAGGSASAASGTPILLGTMGGYTGVQSDSLAKTKDVADAWAKTVNASGGVNGHPVKLFVEDDGSDPAKALQAVKVLIDQDHVMAIVGPTSLVTASWAPYADSKGVPIIGGTQAEQIETTDANIYPAGTGNVALFFGLMAEMKTQKLSSFEMAYCAEVPVCKQATGLVDVGAKIVGGITTRSTSVSSTAPNYTAECLAAQNAKVDTFMTALGAPVGLRVIDDCAKLGFKPQQVNITTDVNSAWLKDANTDGTILLSPNANYVDDSIPAVKQFLDALDKYEPGVRTGDQFSANIIYPWIAGRLFEAAAKAANIGPSSTPADVKTGLYALKGETLGGLTAPLTYTEGKPTLLTCYFAIDIKGGKYVTQGNGQPICPTDSQVSALVAGLAGS
jgi:branched-chain amino acid transport system substrate-binding protein